jgi:hypothetical protein
MGHFVSWEHFNAGRRRESHVSSEPPGAEGDCEPPRIYRLTGHGAEVSGAKSRKNLRIDNNE